MLFCKKCKNCFRNNYDLKRHQLRITPCVKQNINKNIHTNEYEDQKHSFEDQKHSFEENNTCKYCLHTFSTKKHKNRHLLTCKYHNDPIRLLEIENNIIPALPESITECRFCNKIYHNTSNLNKHITICKERAVYKQGLIKEKEQKITINNNCNNTNNNINNNLILNFGQEDLNHIQTENIIELLRSIRKEFKDDQIYLMAGNLITSFDNYIREKPENNNLLIPDAKCMYAETRIKNGWEKVSIEKSLNKAFKKSANELYNKKEEIDNHNDRVFKSNANKQIFSEVKQFGINGFNYAQSPDELRKVKTEFKISKLKNKIDLDF